MDKIYDEYFEKIYEWALKKTNNRFDAEDLTNSVFLAIFEYLNKDIKIEKINNLIWKIAYNIWCTKAKKYIKEKDNIVIDEEKQPLNTNDMTAKIIFREIFYDLENIGFTKNEKYAFKLFYLKGLSIKEISEALNTNESNIKYYLYSARKKIKERYYE